MEPKAIAFSGHMMDARERPSPRFPRERIDEVKAEIEQEVAQRRAQGVELAVGSGACGADILFHEAAQAAGMRTWLVLPYPEEDFLRTAVRGFPGDWVPRYEAIRDAADKVVVLAPNCPLGNAVVSEYCNRVTCGLAQQFNASVGSPYRAEVLALWDGRRGDAIGGTHSMLQYATSHGLRASVLGSLAVPDAVPPTSPPNPDASSAQSVRGIVFCDAKRFSTLHDNQLSAYVHHYLGGVSRILKAKEDAVLMENTWGDGLFVVTDTLNTAASIALGIRDYVASVDWSGFALPDFGVRIATHVGPVHEFHDPVIGRTNFLGSQVNLAARLEPVTAVGHVYCSEAFAAMLSVEDMAADYRSAALGEMALPKEFGKQHVFELDYA